MMLGTLSLAASKSSSTSATAYKSSGVVATVPTLGQYQPRKRVVLDPMSIACQVPHVPSQSRLDGRPGNGTSAPDLEVLKNCLD